jgi:hypothetical protein
MVAGLAARAMRALRDAFRPHAPSAVRKGTESLPSATGCMLAESTRRAGDGRAGGRSGYSPQVDPGAPSLSVEALAAVQRARDQSLSYGVRLLVSPEGRLLVVVGEAHLKLEEASRTGKELVDAFELRGVEGFPRERVFAGRALKVLIAAPRILVRALSLGLVKGSTILDARRASAGYTVPLENALRVPLALHVASAYLTAFFAVAFAQVLLEPIQDRVPDVVVVPLAFLALVFQYHMMALIPALLLQRQSWSWVLHPGIAILSARNIMMVEGTMRMLADHPEPRVALIVMGRAHLAGYERELVTAHGFKRIDDVG